ncbi:hypothetical protein [uncultured Lacinutrix sp.]|uniref:hypothetical protein n=1 Tax=uncultured Lacinutrix sp. TaxID=574032 RepID=UPI00260B8778|nr:hypothetical protein [uncultured Lacinutrix sp.]
MKNLQNLGKPLSKAEQQTVNGGRPPHSTCSAFSNINCPIGMHVEACRTGGWDCFDN